MPEGTKNDPSSGQAAQQGSSAKGEIIAHTSLRGIGAIGVMLYHFLYFYAPDGTRLSLVDLINNYGLILELFFVNSGFIISYMYADFYYKRVTYPSTFRFLWARFARIYPVHILALTLYVGAHTAKYLLPEMNPTGPMDQFFTPPETPFALVASVLMIHAWGVTAGNSWNYVSWAVSAEFAAYLLFPLICLMIGRLKQFGLLLVLASAMVIYWYMDSIFGDINVPGNYGAGRCIAGFALGVVTYHLTPVLKHFTTSMMSALQVVALVAILAMYGFGTSQVLVVLSVALFVFATSENRGWVSNALTWAPLRYLGQFSFTLYMTHGVAGMAARPIIYYLGLAVGDTQSVVWSFVVVAIKSAFAIPFAYLVFKHFEMPMRDRLIKWEKSRRAAAAIAK